MKKVLIIDPSSDSPTWGKNILCRADLCTFTAATAEEGLRIHREKMVDLVITELDLPDMGGEVLCSTIRKEQSLTRTSIIIVCENMPEAVRRARRCGANEQLLKPVDPEQLDDCIGKLLAVSTRKDYRVFFKSHISTDHGLRNVFGSTINISVSGLLVEADDPLTVGSIIPCTFGLPGGRQISAVGEIARFTRLVSRANLYGIRFVSINPNDQMEIERFVAANVPAKTAFPRRPRWHHRFLYGFLPGCRKAGKQ